MATNTMRKPLTYQRDPAQNAVALSAESFGKHVSLSMWLAAGVLLVGTIVDLGVLWLLQRQNQPQWEFVAITNTLEAFPRFALGIATVYAALYFSRSASLLAYRVVALASILLGLAAAALGLLILTDYLALSNFVNTEPDLIYALKSTTMKSMALSALFGILFVPIGFLALRRPKGNPAGL